MAVIIGGTDATLITNFDSMVKFIELCKDTESLKRLCSSKVLVVEPSFGVTSKPLNKGQKAILKLFTRIVEQHRHLLMDFIFILNSPQNIIPEISNLAKRANGDIVDKMVNVASCDASPITHRSTYDS